ncbi:MAG: hypothetical protein OXF11_09860 [Deltaproteobacteria bacterium]|nr:hypothetical protein [Deltaproteobacteria bacterium]
MSQALTPTLQVAAEAVVRKTRELPVPGRILCAPGDVVAADTVVARAELPGDLSILRIPEALGIEPAEALKSLSVNEGDVITEGDLLCEHVGLFGLFRSRFHAPVGGTVEFIAPRTGHVGVRLAPHAIDLNAYVAGTVAAVEPDKSVTIESQGAFIQGIFGVGGERFGPIRMLGGGPKTLLGPAKIPDDVAGQVLVGGTRPTLEALQRAAGNGAAGLVVGSIDDYALTGYLGYDLGMAVTGHEDVSMTVIVTEGFGWLPVAERTHDLLRRLEGRAASINGATQVRAGAVRPEIIVARMEEPAGSGGGKDAGTGALPSAMPGDPATGLRVGAFVRIIREPHFGVAAEIISLPAEPQPIETGARTRVLDARLPDGEIVTVPRANVELL